MKRLNPETGKPFVRGDTRADGFLFDAYCKTTITKCGLYKERWLSPVSKINSDRRKSDWQKNNKPKRRLTSLAWNKQNPVKMNATYAKRRAAKLQRTPPWLTKEHYMEIESVYALAKKISVETGVPHEVDHIVPLQGELVSGLHVPWNLEVKTAEANRSKSNKHCT